jgi:hypothetical protein
MRLDENSIVDAENVITTHPLANRLQRFPLKTMHARRFLL